MSVFKTRAFLRLHSEWTARLQESGFEDIEDTDGQLKSGPERKLAKASTEQRLAVEDYFEAAAEYTWAASFKDEAERLIWRLFSEGHAIRTIAQATGQHRSSVHRSIARHRKAAGLVK